MQIIIYYDYHSGQQPDTFQWFSRRVTTCYNLCPNPSTGGTPPIIVVAQLRTPLDTATRVYSFPTWHHKCHIAMFNSSYGSPSILTQSQFRARGSAFSAQGSGFFTCGSRYEYRTDNKKPPVTYRFRNLSVILDLSPGVFLLSISSRC